MDFSKQFDKIGVRDIGRRSLSISAGGRILGTGRTSAHFHRAGTVPSRRLLLNIAQTGGARMAAWSCKIQLGISSGPVALCVLIRDSDLATSSTLMMQESGTAVSAPGGNKSGGKSLVTDSKKSLDLAATY